MFYWLLKHIGVGPWLKSLYRVDVVGADRIPKRGPVILASNHLSVIDSIFLPLVIRRRIYFLAKSEYFTGSGVKGRLTRWFFLSTGMLPMDRSGGAKSQQSLDSGKEVLEKGGVLGIYPEGTRSPDGRLYRGRTGIARMILEEDKPVTVLPVTMVDTELILPIGAKRPRLGRIGIIIGQPMTFERYRGMPHDRFVLRSITDEIMSEIAAQSSQEYCDAYASKFRDLPAASPAAA